MKNKKTIFGWAIYDWSNSTYALAITTAIFPSYYNSVAKDVSINNEINIVNFLGFDVSSVSLFSYSISFSYLIITLLSPILGSISDYIQNKKIFMLIFSIIGSISCLLLYFFDKNNFSLGIICFTLGSISFAGGNIFNDSMIPDITTPENYSKLSSLGFISGYLGSVIHLIFCLILILNYKVFGFSNSIEPVKFSFILVGVWWLSFSILSYVCIKEEKNKSTKNNELIEKSFNHLKQVYNYAKSNILIKWFLISFFFYNMGVQTALYMSTLYAAQEIKMRGDELIIVILLIQFIAILGTFLITKFSKYISYTKNLALGIILWILLCIYAFLITTSFQFYLLAIGVGFIMGGVQSLSRGVFSLLISERNDNATLFSFYSIVDKASIIFGLLIYGKVNDITQSMRYSIFVLILFFIFALITNLIFREKVKKSEKEIFINSIY